MTRVLLEYPHSCAGHCGSGALRDLAEWAGLGWNGPPQAGLVFALGGGFGFTYLRVPGMGPPIYLVGRKGDLERAVLRRRGADVDFKQSDDRILGWQWVVDELDAGRPVTVWADIAKLLPYLRVRLRMSRHDIVVIGYDKDTNTDFVADDDRDDLQEVPYEALAEARSSTAFPIPTRHATFAARWPDNLPNLPVTAAEAAEACLASAHSMLTGGEDLVDESILPAALLQSQGCAQIAELLSSTEAAQIAAAAAECAAAWQTLARAAVADESLGARSARVARAAAALADLERNLGAALQQASGSLNAVSGPGVRS